MCRSTWDSTIGTLILKLEDEKIKFKKKDFLHKGQKCDGCLKMDIVGQIYKCIWCPSVVLC